MDTVRLRTWKIPDFLALYDLHNTLTNARDSEICNLCFSSDELLAVIEVKASLCIMYLFARDGMAISLSKKLCSLYCHISKVVLDGIKLSSGPKIDLCILKLWFAFLLSSRKEKREPWNWVDNHLRPWTWAYYTSVFLNKVKKLTTPNLHWLAVIKVSAWKGFFCPLFNYRFGNQHITK